MKNKIRGGRPDRPGDSFRIADVAYLVLHPAFQAELLEQARVRGWLQSEAVHACTEFKELSKPIFDESERTHGRGQSCGDGEFLPSARESWVPQLPENEPRQYPLRRAPLSGSLLEFALQALEPRTQSPFRAGPDCDEAWTPNALPKSAAHNFCGQHGVVGVGSSILPITAILVTNAQFGHFDFRANKMFLNLVHYGISASQQ